VEIVIAADNGSLRFRVADDGVGYDAEHTALGSGLRNMSDRLAALGGRLEVRSSPGEGTSVMGVLPASPRTRCRTSGPVPPSTTSRPNRAT
jgi:signal transduction histidine kinase